MHLDFEVPKNCIEICYFIPDIQLFWFCFLLIASRGIVSLMRGKNSLSIVNAPPSLNTDGVGASCFVFGGKNV